jgi:hypothetical protein
LEERKDKPKVKLTPIPAIEQVYSIIDEGSNNNNNLKEIGQDHHLIKRRVKRRNLYRM